MKQLLKLKADTLLALQFFSALKLPGWLRSNFDKQNEIPPKLNEAAIGFPLAGLLIGIPVALMWFFASQAASPFLAAALAIAVGALITGCLHEDGLSDCFDGLGGAANRERILDIMRDSTIGTYGASALFFTFFLRLAALASLTPWLGALTILFAHSVARGTMVLAIYSARYARPTGLADTVSDGMDQNMFYRSMIVTLVISLLLSIAGGGLSGILATVAGFTAAWILLQWFTARIGGYTGDVLGAMEQVAEIAVFITLAVLWT